MLKTARQKWKLHQFQFVFNLSLIWFSSSIFWLRKSTLLDLTERNVNHIIPLYCHLPVSCRSLVDRCGSCKPQIINSIVYQYVIMITIISIKYRSFRFLDWIVNRRNKIKQLYGRSSKYNIMKYESYINHILWSHKFLISLGNLRIFNVKNMSRILIMCRSVQVASSTLIDL